MFIYCDLLGKVDFLIRNTLICSGPYGNMFIFFFSTYKRIGPTDI